jgi:hypothetical protein
MLQLPVVSVRKPLIPYGSSDSRSHPKMVLYDAGYHIRIDTDGSTSQRWSPKNPEKISGPARTSYLWDSNHPHASEDVIGVTKFRK